MIDLILIKHCQNNYKAGHTQKTLFIKENYSVYFIPNNKKFNSR